MLASPLAMQKPCSSKEQRHSVTDTLEGFSLTALASLYPHIHIPHDKGVIPQERKEGREGGREEGKERRRGRGRRGGKVGNEGENSYLIGKAPTIVEIKIAHLQ